MVEGLTKHILIAAMYATASASRLSEDRPSNTGTPGGRWNETTTARSDGQQDTPPTTKSRPHHAEGTACDSPHAFPTPQRQPGSAALRPLLGAGGARRPPPPGTQPSVDTPRHPLIDRHAPPQGRHRAPAPHLAHGPARRPAGGQGSAWPHNQASVPAEGPRPHVQARRPSRTRTTRVCTGPRTRTAASGRTSPTGTTRCPAPPRCAEAQGPRTGITRAQAKSQVEELDQRGSRCPVSRIRHRYPGAAALRVRHGRGPL